MGIRRGREHARDRSKVDKLRGSEAQRVAMVGRVVDPQAIRVLVVHPTGIFGLVKVHIPSGRSIHDTTMSVHAGWPAPDHED